MSAKGKKTSSLYTNFIHKGFVNDTIKPAEDFGPLYRMIDDALHAPLLVTAVNLSIFDRISHPASARDLATRAGWHPGNTEWFLNALAAVHLVEKKDGKF